MNATMSRCQFVTGCHSSLPSLCRTQFETTIAITDRIEMSESKSRKRERGHEAEDGKGAKREKHDPESFKPAHWCRVQSVF